MALDGPHAGLGEFVLGNGQSHGSQLSIFSSASERSLPVRSAAKADLLIHS